MCRLLGVISREAAPLTETLATDLAPFAALSAVHCDGWGMAYWDRDDDLVLRKEAQAASDSERFWDEAKQADTDAAVLHLRKASSGMIPNLANTHPFVAGSVAFAHNGYFSPMQRVEALLSETGGRSPEGDTDSERYFGLVLAAMRSLGPVEALQATAAQIRRASEHLVSLNALVLTHRSLFAFAYWDESVPPSAEAGTATYELMFRVSADSVTVASDGWEPPGPQWERIANGMVLEVRRDDLRVTVHRG
ncbi:class II glutamine amidotransferase [Jatrophihabitans telluris]|uniref:Class II glutamine amidotransferase n=1 Tax=Jatrophihabitans telluris TaxID=2038343 RepID=A0ABY4QZZ4_9ACTN|nr:class II glutamine amidotransferase [Jatrophihabitans telluris]UQX89054.1 class II glutamine amidotransferase [Jatrophihabitans telluris]